MRLVVTAAQVQAFVALTGDASPVHVDPERARRTRFRRTIVHGMLPVAAVLLARRGARLRALDVRFTAPCFEGDALSIDVREEPLADGARALQFTIARDGAVVTSGTAELAPAVEPPSPALRPGPLRLSERTFADLLPGLEEALPVTSAPGALAAFRAAIDPDAPAEDAADPSIFAALATSTLVGMRLPGRHATLTAVACEFSAPVRLPFTLSGTVTKLFAGSGRARVALAWSQDGNEAGRGEAHVLVEAPLAAAAPAPDAGLGLAGRVALVVGASRGIGEATARLLAAHGARVAVGYFRGTADARAVAEEIRAAGGDALAVQVDLRDDASVGAMFDSVRAAWGDVEVLVNCAVADFAPTAAEDLSSAALREEFEVSVVGLHACCRRAIGPMRRARRGKIVNLGSVVTEAPVASQARYAAAKGAVVAYTRSLAVELAADGVQVNVVVPSMTATSLLAGLPAGIVARAASESPTGRLLEPAEVARAVVFLASAWADPISGQQLVLAQGSAPFP